MRFPRPRSLNGLMLTGFALVTVPLLFAVVWALYQIGGFARQSESLLADSNGTVTRAKPVSIRPFSERGRGKR
ncbi:MAG: hypothetical protein AAFX58_11330, partial [Pseudomonadota bacterium]